MIDSLTQSVTHSLTHSLSHSLTHTNWQVKDAMQTSLMWSFIYDPKAQNLFLTLTPNP